MLSGRLRWSCRVERKAELEIEAFHSTLQVKFNLPLNLPDLNLKVKLKFPVSLILYYTGVMVG